MNTRLTYIPGLQKKLQVGRDSMEDSSTSDMDDTLLFREPVSGKNKDLLSLDKYPSCLHFSSQVHLSC